MTYAPPHPSWSRRLETPSPGITILEQGWGAHRVRDGPVSQKSRQAQGRGRTGTQGS